LLSAFTLCEFSGLQAGGVYEHFLLLDPSIWLWHHGFWPVTVSVLHDTNRENHVQGEASFFPVASE